MIKKCNYSSFFNEFNINYELKCCLIQLYNGYFFSTSYEKNLSCKISTYKHDLLYSLPLHSNGKPDVLLKNLHEELCKKENKLKRFKKYCRKKRSNAKDDSTFSLTEQFKIKYQLRNFRMQNKQLFFLRDAKRITEQAIENFEQELIKEEKAIYENEISSTNSKADLKPKTKSNIMWKGDKVGLIQLVKSLIKSEDIIIGSLRENEAIDIISKFFNLSLNRNNFSSFSRAIHSNNYDYEPDIFNKTLKSYKLIVQEKRDELENSKK